MESIANIEPLALATMKLDRVEKLVQAAESPGTNAAKEVNMPKRDWPNWDVFVRDKFRCKYCGFEAAPILWRLTR
jgi:hypothetical protein